tara:strand:- start:479 stop:952 length:474 start_codon:yes stop_codon:yes gene_type:complete
MDDIDPDDLISQLKNLPTDSKMLERAATEYPELSKEDVEEFVINKSSKLIQDSLELIDNMKEVVHHMPEAENISSLAELIKASSGAIETLNKIVIQDKKTNTTITSKKMDIESRRELQTSDQSHALTMSREEIMARLINDKTVIDVNGEVAEPDKIT